MEIGADGGIIPACECLFGQAGRILAGSSMCVVLEGCDVVMERVSRYTYSSKSSTRSIICCLRADIKMLKVVCCIW